MITAGNCLCDLPAEPANDCCDPAPRLPAAPIIPYNQPGLSAIRYRIGTFGSFRRAMLDDVARVDLLGSTPNPFVIWREGTAGDYQTMLVELWAYLADVLTFYQERIANEAYLPTATQRDSLRRLAELIAYHPGPGAAASAQLAFTVEAGKSLVVPVRFRTSSKAAPGKTAATFETEAALTALGEHSAIPLSSVAPTNQFASLGDFGSIFAGFTAEVTLQQAASHLYGSAGATYEKTFLTAEAAVQSTGTGSFKANPAFNVASPHPLTLSGPASGETLLTASASIGQITSEVGNNVFVYKPFRGSTTRAVVLKGSNTRLAVGDYVLIVENEGDGNENTTLQQITTVNADKTADTTTITWTEASGSSYQNVTLYALRLAAGPFGNNAPAWDSLPPALTNSDGKNGGAPYDGKNWDDGSNTWSFLPTPGDASNAVFLDAVYSQVKGTAGNPGWIVLMTDSTSNVFHVVDARPVSKAAYAVSAKVTRVTFQSGESIPSSTFPLRGTVVLAGSEQLTLQNNLPLPDPLAGDTLILAGLYPKLSAGQEVILRGNLYDPNTVPPSQVPSAESGILKSAPVLDQANGITTVVLTKPLASQYARTGAVLLANVVDATQGETVRDEILGSGDGSAFQSYRLKQKPVTYLPSTDPEGLSAVQSTLLVTVNGVAWTEQPTLLDSTPTSSDYTTTLDETGLTTVVFGDGINGARPPTGRDNVHASYRKGLGVSGNVGADGIQQLVDSAPGLQKVTNPLPSIGGADQESASQIRVNAPNSVRTFGRAVSAADYAALALSYPGVAKASASWVLRDPTTLVAIPQPYVRLTVATADQVPLAQQTSFARSLRAFLDKRRDPNVPLRIVDFTPIYLDVAATIDVKDRYPRQATLQAALAALNPGINPDNSVGFFAFERLDFGESIHLSAVYAALQAVPGVRDATITTLRLPATDHDPNTVRDDVFIRPTELAMVKNDPADTANQFGKLTITLGTGGFVDT